MQYVSKYQSPLGEIVISADEKGLTGLYFSNQKHYKPLVETKDTEKPQIIADTERWLDIYFSGENPDLKIPFHFIGTPFQNEVWELLCLIPYGKTVTYGEIAKVLSERKGIKKMSAQAVGGAVGRNKISIIVPCHRVVGSNGNLTGYAGGLERKKYLLELEKVNSI